MKKNCIITRFEYSKEQIMTDEYSWRLGFYKNKVLPRLKKQTNQNFDIWVWTNPWQEKELQSLGVNTFQVDNPPRNIPGRRQEYYYNFAPWDKVIGLPKYEIQTAVDSDELVESDFNELIIKNCEDGKRKHIHFQPIKLDIKTGNTYKAEEGSKNFYSERRGSPTFSIYQPDGEYLFLHHTSHTKMPRHFDVSIKIDGHVFMGIHDYNDSTTINSGDKIWKTN